MDANGSQPGRSVDIELGGQEVITIDLDNLDPNPEDVLELLEEGRGRIWVWTKLAAEYWRRGYLDAAERIANAVVDKFQATGANASLPPIYMLLANIQIARARDAPKIILPDARQDNLTKERRKEELNNEAAQLINKAEKFREENPEDAASTNTLLFLTRGVHQLATRSIDDALRSFESVLTQQPRNLVALLGKARILYARRQYSAALKIFQNVLQLNPKCKPDPRIGIGLCLWAMDFKSKAKAAWQRSLELHNQEVEESGVDDGEGWAAQLLLGLEGINSSKNEQRPEQERKRLFVTGTKLVETAFKTNRKSAAAANALCEIVLQKGNHKQALKLAERTIQFADTITVLTDGYLRAARVSHAEGSLSIATKYYKSALEGQPKNILGVVGLAQLQLQNDETAGAIHTLDSLFQPPNPQKSQEATIMLASLLAIPRPGVSAEVTSQNCSRARDLFDSAMKGYEIQSARTGQTTRSQRHIMEDVDMHVAIARLWEKDNLGRVSKSLGDALRCSELPGKGRTVDPRLLNNLGALMHMEGDHAGARGMYEKALTATATTSDDGSSSSILYNLARVYEDQGETAMAKDAYDKLLARHPEYVDAKIRQAFMLTHLQKNNDALELVKQALASQNSNLEVRAFYVYFLIQANLPKVAREFVYGTLKDFDRHDVYSLCALALTGYNQARESRDTSSQGVDEKKRNYLRSAEFYEKALQRDPMCAFAAQGLAIITAEDALGVMGGFTQPASGSEEMLRRMNNAREALDIFAKVRETVNDGSVYQNMGHCYYARDEFDRAIESALHLQPNDKSTLYNIAMIQQKSAEMLFALPPAKRTLKDLQRAIDYAGHAQKLFASLVADRASALPYSRDIADQRRKYGDSMLRKAGDHLASQKEHEAETQARLEAARARRQEEKDRHELAERAKLEELRREAEKLAEERRIARETAQEWSRDIRMESDEEKERKAKKVRKAKPEPGSGDEGEPKKKRRGKLRKAADAEEEQAAVFSDEDDTDRPVKKRGSKKRVVRDEEDEAANPRKKQFKSKEMLSDTDEEMS
ncbi:hypothetical protein ONZ45_g7046 [Pleurotus djamor]|nr:hypothetical protein ONZ45_g7046 [Pleurotus djamor]